MPAFGWTIFTVAIANRGRDGIGGWRPWSVPVLFNRATDPRNDYLGTYSYIIVISASLLSLAATFYLCRNADQSK